jgi:hypothetical protein
MLALREIANLVIDPRRSGASNSRRRPARGAFDTHAVLNALLVAHASMLSLAPAPVVRKKPRLTHIYPNPSPEPGKQKRLQPAVAASGFDPFK